MASAHQWPFLRLDGSCSVKARQALVNSFNDPSHPSFLLLLSSKAGGVGLNIIGANRLFLFDPGASSVFCAFVSLWRRGASLARSLRRSLARALSRRCCRSPLSLHFSIPFSNAPLCRHRSQTPPHNSSHNPAR